MCFLSDRIRFFKLEKKRNFIPILLDFWLVPSDDGAEKGFPCCPNEGTRDTAMGVSRGSEADWVQTLAPPR